MKSDGENEHGKTLLDYSFSFGVNVGWVVVVLCTIGLAVWFALNGLRLP